MLIDRYGRNIHYLRLAVTDRCNLRCFYCMPEHGLDWLSRNELLTYEEMLRLCTLLATMGVNKVRITGGEPFARKNIIHFLRELAAIPGIDELTITTNGVLVETYIDDLKAIGVRSINLSLDTLDRQRFEMITRRDDFDKVWQSVQALLKADIGVKLNAVVMDGKNTEDILPLCALTEQMPVDVRFIEEMPFNGHSHEYVPTWDHNRILGEIRNAYPHLVKVPDKPGSTAYNYHVPGHKGMIGIIAAWSRTFCGTCNRIRITPQGMLKTCLYDHGAANLRELLRNTDDDNVLKLAIINAVTHKAVDGIEAAKILTTSAGRESMATIGG